MGRFTRILFIERKIQNSRAFPTNLNGGMKILLSILTFIIISVTWIFFRSENINDAMSIFNNLYHLSMSRNPTLSYYELIGALGTSLFLLSWHIYRKNSSIEILFSKSTPIMRGLMLLSMITGSNVGRKSTTILG